MQTPKCLFNAVESSSNSKYFGNINHDHVLYTVELILCPRWEKCNFKTIVNYNRCVNIDKNPIMYMIPSENIPICLNHHCINQVPTLLQKLEMTTPLNSPQTQLHSRKFIISIFYCQSGKFRVQLKRYLCKMQNKSNSQIDHWSTHVLPLKPIFINKSLNCKIFNHLIKTLLNIIHLFICIKYSTFLYSYDKVYFQIT